MAQRLRLLLIAPSCDGQDVGEAWVGYQWASRLAKRHDVTLLTYHKRGRRPASRQLSGLRVIEWADPIILGRVRTFQQHFKPGYVPFYFKARRWLRHALARGSTLTSPINLCRSQCVIRARSQVLEFPMLLGLLAEASKHPTAFDQNGTRRPGMKAFGNWTSCGCGFDPLLRQTYEEASCVIGIGSYVRDFLADRSLRRFEIMSETAIEELPPEVDRSCRGGPVRLLYVGRLVRTKGARDAICAFDFLRDLSVRLDIVGDGFDRTACEKLTSELGLTDRVIFHGRTPRD